MSDVNEFDASLGGADQVLDAAEALDDTFSDDRLDAHSEADGAFGDSFGVTATLGGPTDGPADLDDLDDLDPQVVDVESAYQPVHDTASVSLFEGDEGSLEYGQRHALVTLLKSRFISARTHPRDWRALVEHEGVLRSRLNDLFLELQIDREREVAWKRQATSETASKFPTLLHDTAWSREETLVLVHLRDRLRAGLAGGETKVFVDMDDVLDYVASFRPPHATDESGDEKRARNAVASVAKAGLLIATGTDERWEVSEAVEPLLPLELLKELLAALQRANEAQQAPPEKVEDLFGQEWDADETAPGTATDASTASTDEGEDLR